MFNIGSRYRAIVMRGYGQPDVLRIEQIAVLPLRPGELRMQMITAAINHTDLKIRTGEWPIRGVSPFPYIPGVEAVGEVVEIASGLKSHQIGDKVITMMQGLAGVTAVRQGGYAEFVSGPAIAFARFDESHDGSDIAALGLAAVTAFEGLRLIGDLHGKDIVVTGAGGGVGSAAVALARAQGARVTAIVSRPETAEYASSIGALHVLVGKMPDAASSDGVLDTVAGPLFGPCVAALRRHGTYALVGAVAGADVTFDAWQLLSPVRLTGYSSEDLTGSELQSAIGAIAALLANGKLRVPQKTFFKLAEAAKAHALIEGGNRHGRVLLIP